MAQVGPIAPPAALAAGAAVTPPAIQQAPTTYREKFAGMGDLYGGAYLLQAGCGGPDGSHPLDPRWPSQCLRLPDARHPPNSDPPPHIAGPVSYTHLTLPTILRV